jgi:hypothetical protein
MKWLSHVGSIDLRGVGRLMQGHVGSHNVDQLGACRGGRLAQEHVGSIPLLGMHP